MLNTFFAHLEDVGHHRSRGLWALIFCGDSILSRILKACADHLAEVFTDIFNISLSQSVVSTCFKMSTIVPVPKKVKVTQLNVTAVGGRRWGPRCSVVSVHIIYLKLNTKYKNNKRNNWNSSERWNKHKTEMNYPQNPCGKKLPKYGSQSETTIDSCLWLRTTPGQTTNKFKT